MQRNEVTRFSPQDKVTWDGLLSSIGLQLNATFRILNHLLEALEHEQECIRRYDLSGVESGLARKEQMIGQIQSNFLELRKNIASWMSLMGVQETDKLSDFTILLRNILAESSLSSQQLEPIQSCLNHVSKTLQKFSEVGDKIATQKIVNTRMLQYLQLSYKFWVETGKECESSYDAKAARKEPAVPISQIEVKA